MYEKSSDVVLCCSLSGRKCQVQTENLNDIKGDDTMLMSRSFKSEFQIREIQFQCRERRNRINLPSKLIIAFCREEEFAIKSDYDNFGQRLFIGRELS